MCLSGNSYRQMLMAYDTSHVESQRLDGSGFISQYMTLVLLRRRLIYLPSIALIVT